MPQKLTREIFIKRSNIIHKNKYDYSKVEYKNSHTKVTIICPIENHGDFLVTPSHHMNSQTGCCKCSGNHKYTTLEYIAEVTKIHGDKYDYSKTIYVNAHSKIKVICPIHGDFVQNPQCHRSGQGCPECSVFNRKVDTDIFIEDSRKIHGNKYDYSKVEYTKNKNKVTIICPKHGDFEQQALSHKRGFGCPRCAITQTSKPAILWLSYCGLTNEIQYKVEKDDEEYLIPDTRYKADGYCKDTNTIYEFHGDFWHGNPKIYDQNKINPRTQTTFGTLYEKKEKKKTILISKGYKYVELWENEWNEAIKLVKYIQIKWRKKLYMGI